MKVSTGSVMLLLAALQENLQEENVYLKGEINMLVSPNPYDQCMIG